MSGEAIIFNMDRQDKQDFLVLFFILPILFIHVVKKIGSYLVGVLKP